MACVQQRVHDRLPSLPMNGLSLPRRYAPMLQSAACRAGTFFFNLCLKSGISAEAQVVGKSSFTVRDGSTKGPGHPGEKHSTAAAEGTDIVVVAEPSIW